MFIYASASDLHFIFFFVTIKLSQREDLWQPHFQNFLLFTEIREVLRELLPASAESQMSLV